jgi:Na+-driven multidrug efflux pump
VHAAIVGHLGGSVLAGVGLGSILCGAFNWVFGFLSVLTIPLVATAMAQNQKEEACSHIGQALWVAVLVGCSTMLFVMAQAPALVQSAPQPPPLPCLLLTIRYLTLC